MQPNKLTALALCCGLAACNAPQVDDTQTADAVARVQSTAAALCGFVPAASTIAGIFTSNPDVQTATQIAAIICSVVTKKGARHWQYRGVVIKGHFVKG